MKMRARKERGGVATLLIMVLMLAAAAIGLIALRGPAAEQRQGRYQGARLMADFEAVAIAVDGAPVRLTRREFELLQYLVQNKNRVVSRDRLLERV